MYFTMFALARPAHMLVLRPERHWCINKCCCGYSTVCCAAGPIPTIQELEAEDARDDDADSMFGEHAATEAGVMQ